MGGFFFLEINRRYQPIPNSPVTIRRGRWYAVSHVGKFSNMSIPCARPSGSVGWHGFFLRTNNSDIESDHCVRAFCAGRQLCDRALVRVAEAFKPERVEHLGGRLTRYR